MTKTYLTPLFTIIENIHYLIGFCSFEKTFDTQVFNKYLPINRTNYLQLFMNIIEVTGKLGAFPFTYLYTLIFNNSDYVYVAIIIAR